MLKLAAALLLVFTTSCYAQTAKKKEAVTTFENGFVKILLQRANVSKDQIRVLLFLEDKIPTGQSKVYYTPAVHKMNSVIDGANNVFFSTVEPFEMEIVKGQPSPLLLTYALDGDTPVAPLIIKGQLVISGTLVTFGFTNIPIKE